MGKYWPEPQPRGHSVNIYLFLGSQILKIASPLSQSTGTMDTFPLEPGQQESVPAEGGGRACLHTHAQADMHMCVHHATAQASTLHPQTSHGHGLTKSKVSGKVSRETRGLPKTPEGLQWFWMETGRPYIVKAPLSLSTTTWPQFLHTLS